jgi:hypothetical protein
MRAFELITAIIVGLVLLLVLKAIGILLKFAVIVALVGMAIGFATARALRRKAQ